jgi:methionyl-tRNA formyltransferase
LSRQGAEILLETLFKLAAGEITPIPQEEAQASYAPLIKKEDYEINWQRASLEIHNQVRGFYPNCFSSFRGQNLKITATLPLEADLPPNLGKVGEIVALRKNQGPVVQTGQGYLLLSAVHLAGKKAQSGSDFVNGARVTVGESLG